MKKNKSNKKVKIEQTVLIQSNQRKLTAAGYQRKKLEEVAAPRSRSAFKGRRSK